MTDDLLQNPREHSDWRRHKRGCPHYRERWFPDSDLEAGEPIYQVFCLMNTPPTSFAEQERCLVSRARCWRLAPAAAAHQADDATPIAAADGAKRPA